VFTWEWGLMDYALRYGPCSYEGIAFHVATRYCTPLTCADLDASCGALSDGCFSTIDCGYCASSSTCGGGGDENVCGSLCSGGGTWTYEAESQYHQIGAVNGAGWEVSPGSAGPGWLVYGPFTTALPRDAEYTASFRMLTNEGPYSDNPVVNIEVYDWYSGTMLAQRTIKQRDFAAAWQRQDFVLHFRTALAGSRLELRTYWWGYHYVHADLVDVRGCPRECSLDYESCASTPCCDGVQCNPINQRCQVACAIGNACASSADCCAGQSCNSGGRCYVPCPEGGACVTNADCCGGQMCWDRVCRNAGSVCLGAGELCRGIRVGGDPFPPCCAGLACGADDHCAGSTGTGTCVSAGMSCVTPSGERLTCCAGTICGTDGVCR